jgi:hypothetical protein
MPTEIHQMEKWESRASALDAKGWPLSVRMRSGRPYSLKSRVKLRIVVSEARRVMPRHSSRNRVWPSNAPFTDNSDLLPGWGFLSTLSDLVAFGSGLLRGTLLLRETVEMLFTPMGPVKGFNMEYGFGWNVLGRDESRNDRALMHPGGTTGAPRS